MSLTMISAPMVTAISVDEVKLNSRMSMSISTEDSLIELLISAATEKAEHVLGRALITRQYKLKESISTGAIWLRMPPLVSVDEVRVIASDGTESVIDSAGYKVDDTALVPRLALIKASGEFVAVTYTAGYGEAGEAVPAGIRRWLLVAVNSMYEQREEVVTGTIVSEVPRTFIDGLLDSFRVEHGV